MGPSGQRVRKDWKPCGGSLLAGLLADPGLWQSTVVLDNQRLFSERRDGAVQFLGILASQKSLKKTVQPQLTLQ